LVYLWGVRPAPAHSGISPPDLASLLDEHHLVVIGDHALCDAVGHMLHAHLEARPETVVIRLDGSTITDAEAFSRRFGLRRPQRGATSPVTEVISRRMRRLGDEEKWLYVIWDRADVLLEADVHAFSQITNTLLAVAALSEHLDPDVLRIQRVVFLGDDKLGAYAEDSSGQFRVWLDDDVDEGVDEDDGDALWRITTCVPAPPVLTYRLNG
jgi:hypothetical protein